MDTILKNGIIVTAQATFQGDIRISGEIIAEVVKGSIKATENDKVLDVSGKYIFPGGIDAHTHFDMPFGSFKTSDTFEQGTRAAVLGGTTTILDFAEPDSGCPLQQGLDNWHKKADGNCYTDYGFHMTVTNFDGDMPAQMKSMTEQGITSFKIYTAYAGLKVSDGVAYHVMKQAKELDALVMVHCENGDLLTELIKERKQQNSADISNHPLTRPDVVEKEAVSRIIDIAGLADAKVYIVHLSSKLSLEAALYQRERGAKVLIETCPHYLVLDDSKYHLEGFESAKFVMSPPLRGKESCEALWAALGENQIQTVSTDHCSFNFVGQKDKGMGDFTQIPNGIPSVENRMSLLYTFGVKTGKISLNQFVELTATNPAKIFGIYPKKGEIAPGSDADLIIVEDIAKAGGKTITAATQAQHVDYTPYEGAVIEDKIQDVFLRGTQIVTNGEISSKSPSGKFQSRNNTKT